MRLTVNGEAHDVPNGTTVRALLEILALGVGPVAVERNGDVVPRAEHERAVLAEGDVIEVVHFVGGG